MCNQVCFKTLAFFLCKSGLGNHKTLSNLFPTKKTGMLRYGHLPL